MSAVVYTRVYSESETVAIGSDDCSVFVRNGEVWWVSEN